MMRALSATPATPSALSRCAATVPATCVPCVSLSAGAVQLRVLVREVPAVDVVLQAVAVVVDVVARDLAGVRPQAAREVGVGRVDARVDDRDGHGGPRRRRVPAGRGADLRQRPLRPVQRVVRHVHRVQAQVEVDGVRRRLAGQQRTRPRQRQRLVQRVDPPPAGQPGRGVGVQGAGHAGALRGGRARVDPHQDLVAGLGRHGGAGGGPEGEDGEDPRGGRGARRTASGQA